MECVIGVDVGTSSTKSALVALDGRPIRGTTREHVIGVSGMGPCVLLTGAYGLYRELYQATRSISHALAQDQCAGSRG